MIKIDKRIKRKFSVRNPKAIIALILVLLILPVVFLVKDKVITLFSQAAPIPANIAVDVSNSQATLQRPWQGISQGGETEENGVLVSLSPVRSQLKALKPQYIRIDHVLERPYEARVKEIVAVGATPIIALSYFPADVADRDIGTARNWQAWKNHVRRLVENVSGRNNMNIQGVYYEVWNEPDGEGFGGYDIGEGKDYFKLYTNTVDAILSAKDVNDFKVGGPSLADLRRCSNGSILHGLLKICQKFWLDQFLSLVSANNSRLDYISWHRYSLKISDYNDDVNFINDQYLKYGNLPPAEKVITEWGSDPARNPIHNSFFDAAHLVAAARTFIGHVDLSTKFEVRDGPTSENQGWGVLTYDGRQKPAYQALQLLNMLRTERVLLSGEGTYVTGIASRDSSGATVILSNYDSRQRNIESPNFTIRGLTPGTYRVNKLTINAPKCPVPDARVLVPDGVFRATDIPKCSDSSHQVMPVNSVVLYDLQLIGLK
jgi:hypothetical protein